MERATYTYMGMVRSALKGRGQVSAAVSRASLLRLFLPLAGVIRMNLLPG
jgi:hypothetical protein